MNKLFYILTGEQKKKKLFSQFILYSSLLYGDVRIFYDRK